MAARFRIGTALQGRYVLLDPVGHGGVSIVYRALDTVAVRQVAVKALDPTFAGDENAHRRIRREALITDRVRHPGVPQVYEYGEAPLADGTVVPYVVMELLVGTVLTGTLNRGPLPWGEAVRVAAAVADVLVAAHRRGVVHRDLTPANIMLTAGGAKIIDFGVAITIDAPDPGKGRFVLEPPTGFANEFAGPGEPADDVYALGVLLYQMLTGRSPYQTAHLPPPVAVATMNWVAPTPVLIVPRLPRAVAEMVRACMAKRAGDRPDAAAAALGLWSFIVPSGGTAGDPTGTPARVLPVIAAPDEPTVRLPAKPQTRSARARRPRRRPSWTEPTTGQNAAVSMS